MAEQTGCHGDLLEDDLAPCLRNKPLAELLAVRLEPPRFLPGFAPFVDGTVIVNPSSVSDYVYFGFCEVGEIRFASTYSYLNNNYLIELPLLLTIISDFVSSHCI